MAKSKTAVQPGSNAAYIGASPEYRNHAYGDLAPYDAEDNERTAELEKLAKDYERSAKVKSVDASAPEVVVDRTYQEIHPGIEDESEDVKKSAKTAPKSDSESGGSGSDSSSPST